MHILYITYPFFNFLDDFAYNVDSGEVEYYVVYINELLPWSYTLIYPIYSPNWRFYFLLSLFLNHEVEENLWRRPSLEQPCRKVIVIPLLLLSFGG